jgi:hypothetical protein
VADSLDDLVHRADLDALVRHVDDTCSSRDWHHLLRVRDATRAAVDTGRQLWPIATLANYRLALRAPADMAVRAFDDSARTFMPGPVSEILAQHHTWEELSPLLHAGHDRALVAYERALRGDAVDPREPALLDIPVAPLPWEPTYALAAYDDDGVHAPPPDVVSAPWRTVRGVSGRPLTDPTVDAFRQMMAPWTAQSNGRASAAVTEGGTEEALGAIGVDSARVTDVTPADALAHLAWAAADGGAKGRRRGAASGRGEAWWLLAVFLGVEDPWPVDPGEMGGLVPNLECCLFENDEAPTAGWGLGLILVDRDEGLSCALVARDGL